MSVARARLKPGEHGSVSYSVAADGRVRARARLRLLDGSEAQVSRVGRTRDDARSAVQEAISERLGAAQGSAELRPTSKVGLACRQWITEMRRRSEWPDPPIRPQSVDEYERVLGNHVVPSLGALRLYELTPPLCQAWVDEMVAKGKTGRYSMVATISQAATVFRKVLDRAVVHDAIKDNPMRKVELPRRATPVPRAMTPLAVYRLRKAVRDWEEARRGRPGPAPTGNLRAAVDVMLGTGLRIGEVLALRWGDVDLAAERPTLTVSGTLVDIKGRGTVRQEVPKSRAGERTIFLPPFTVEALTSIQPDAPASDRPVFLARPFRSPSAERRPQTTHNLRTSLRAALELAGLDGTVHPHLLRATVATFVARQMSIADAAALLGHKLDAGVTVRYYIERLTLAPDTSAVLQTFIELGAAEARAVAPDANTDDEPDGDGWDSRSPETVSPDVVANAWTQSTLDDDAGW